MPTASIAIAGRPRPVRDAAVSHHRWLGLIGSLIIGLVGFGVLTTVQGDALVGLLGLIPGLVNAVTTALTAFGIAAAAEPLVTPVTDPRDADGNPLLPASAPPAAAAPATRSSLFGVPDPTGRRPRRPSDNPPPRPTDRDRGEDYPGNPLGVLDPTGTYTTGALFGTDTGTGEGGNAGADASNAGNCDTTSHTSSDTSSGDCGGGSW